MAGQYPANQDRLIMNQLRPPLLNDFMQSARLRDSLMGIGKEIKARYISKVPKESGRLAQTVRVKAKKSYEHPDRRWYVDVNIGGIMGVDYADDIEREYGILASVLREMGYNTGDVVSGPRGRGAKEAPPKPVRRTAKSADERQAESKARPEESISASMSPGYNRLAEFIDAKMRPGRRYGSKAYQADYEELKRITQEVEEQYGPLEASVGKYAIGTYEAMMNARQRNQAQRDQEENYKVVWYEVSGRSQRRRTRSFTVAEDADDWARENLNQNANPRLVPNPSQLRKYREDKRYDRGVMDKSNYYGAIMRTGKPRYRGNS